jgi:uncharacterized integral membrane protein
MTLTRREKHALIVCALIALVFVIFKPDQNTTETIEYFGLLFIVLPLAIYVAGDPERKKEGK